MPEAILRISGELLVDLFKVGDPRTYAIVSDGLPDDTQLVDVRMLFGQPPVVLLTLDSASFPAPDDSMAVPELPPVRFSLYTRYDIEGQRKEPPCT